MSPPFLVALVSPRGGHVAAHFVRRPVHDAAPDSMGVGGGPGAGVGLAVSACLTSGARTDDRIQGQGLLSPVTMHWRR